jgi:hypothetical protein
VARSGSFNGVDGQTYMIQASTNLNSPTNWVMIATNTLSGGAQNFTDANTSGISNRFYRAVFLP